MKIIECITDTNIGGAGILLVNRLSETDLQKYDITVLLPQGSLLKRKLLPLGVHFIEIKGKGDRSLNFGALFQYIKIIKTLSPELINAHSSFCFRIAAAICRVPVRICTRHCAYPVPRRFKNRVFRRIFQRMEAILSHRYIAVADAAKENLEDMGIPSDRIDVIINGSAKLRELCDEDKQALRKQLGIPQDALILIMCARLEKCKGHSNMFEVISNGSHENAYLLLLGTGSIEKELKEYGKKLGISSRLRFLGFVWDIAPYMNLADINVNCSMGTETSCLALSEGMSIGKPCIASNYGGNPYIVKDGKNGLLYSVGNTKELSLAIERLSCDNKLYKYMSSEARSRFERELNSREMSRRTYIFYESVREAVKSDICI